MNMVFIVENATSASGLPGAGRAVSPAFALLAAAALSAGLGACGTATSASTTGAHRGTVDVVAAENFWGSIAAQIGGRDARVTSMITSPNADPHLYETDARDAAAVARAQVVIENGIGYDSFMSNLLAGSPNAGRTVVDVQSVLGIHGTNANPHVWYDLPRIPEVARAIESALAGADPAGDALFAQNLVAFDASLAPIESVLSTIRAKYAGAPVAYTERVPAYLLGDAGLRDVTPAGYALAIEDGVEPSASDTHAMDALVSARRIKVLVYNEQTVSSETDRLRALAAAAGVPVVGVTETMPASDNTYQQWQLAQSRALLTALGG